MAGEIKIEVGDYLMIGEAVTGISAEDLRRSVKLGGLESAFASRSEPSAG